MDQVQTIEEILSLIHKNNEKIKSFGVERLGIFGSFTRNQQKKESDIDILVEFKEDKKTFRNFINLAFFLEDLLGRKVELVTPESVSPYLKPYILEKIEYVKVA